MKNNYAYYIVPVILLVIYGCGSSQYLEGNRFYNNLGFGKAIPFYEKALEQKNIPDAKIKLADACRRVNNYVKAEYWYSQVVTMPQSKTIHKLFYADALIKNGKCGEAIKWLDIYAKENPADTRAQAWKASCQMPQTFKKDSLMYHINKVQIQYSESSDFSPVYYKEGIVFPSERNKSVPDKNSAWTNRPFLDLFYAKIDQSNNLHDLQPLKGDINSKYNEGPVTFNSEGTLAYFTRNNFENRKAKKDNDGIVNLKIYKATLDGEEWTHIESLSFNSDDFSTGHPTLSSDGQTIFFISDRPNGHGGTDIYFSTLGTGVWSEPVSLGSAVNTPGDEMFPYLYNDTILFFASDGHAGLGGLDIFYSIKRDDKWTPPVNIGYPVNSTRDDFGYIADASGNLGYFSSNREGSGELDHIFSFVKGTGKIVLNGLVVDRATHLPIEGASIEIYINDETQKEVTYSSADGIFNFDLNPYLVYKVSVGKNDYLTQSKQISSLKSISGDTMKIIFELELIEINKPIVLENIYYDFDKWEIRADAVIELNRLVALMKDNPKIRIELGSHADSRGTSPYNKVLTQRRAQSVVNYLISQGISAERMIPTGYGETKPVNICVNGIKCSEEMHQQNRRTEFTIIEISQLVQIK